MRQSESIEKLAPALVAAGKATGGAVRGAENPFFKNQYADLNAVIAALKPTWAEHGLTVVQHPYSDANGVGVATRIIHESGEWLEESFTLPMAKPDPQQAGSAITYAKRYALKAIGLMADVDDDAEAAMFRVEKVKTTKDWVEELSESIAIIKDGLETGDLHKAFEAWAELTDEEKRGIWVAPTKDEHAPFTTQERAIMKSDEWNAIKNQFYGDAA